MNLRSTPLGSTTGVAPYVADRDVTLYHGDALETLRLMEAGSVDCCVTSPPYWGLRDYGADGQLGLEATPEAYVQALVAVMRELRRVLADDGTLWLNLGDSYVSDPGKGGSGTPNGRNNRGEDYGRERMAQVRDGKAVHGDVLRPYAVQGLLPKNLVGIPWRVAFALQADGWYLRSDIIWSKPNPMPESVTDRPTKAHEYVFLLSKQPRYYYDADAIKEPAAWERWGAQTPRKTGDAMSRGASYIKDRSRQELLEMAGLRNKRSVWEVATSPYADAHFAVFPEALILPCILAGCPEGGVVLDPFGGSGTTALVARKHGRRAVLIELSEAYCELAAKRLQQLSLLAEGAA